MTPWTTACQASLFFTKSQSLLKLMSIESLMPSCHLIPSPAFNLSQHQGLSSESVLHIRWPKYWSFSFSISPSNDYSKLISFRMNWLDLLAVQRDSQESSSAPQFKSINSSALNFLYGPTLSSIHDFGKDRRFDYIDLCQQRVSAF